MMHFVRRSECEPAVVGQYSDAMPRYYDEVSEKTIVKIFSGGYYVTHQPDELIITILGSCISACIRDPASGVGGMNHFLLPSTQLQGDSNPMRFGSFAMEQLLNELYKRGAQKSRLETKLFGGASVIPGLSDIGATNIRFVHQFLRNEGLGITAEDVGGCYPRRIHYTPDTGHVRMRKLQRQNDREIVHQEQQYLTQITQDAPSGDIELFD